MNVSTMSGDYKLQTFSVDFRDDDADVRARLEESVHHMVQRWVFAGKPKSDFLVEVAEREEEG